MARKRTSNTANAARCKRYQERRKQLYGVRRQPIWDHWH